MDKTKIKEDYELIKAALKNKQVIQQEQLDELRDYFNNIIINSIKTNSYSHAINYDDGRTRDNVISIVVKIPKDTIDSILGTSNWISNDIDTLEYIIERDLEKLYNEYATHGELESMDELEFTISMDFENENTIAVTIDIESDITVDFSNGLEY
jgi:hypothetical protein